MVILRRTLETCADDVVTRFVVVPPRPFEIEHGGGAFVEHHCTGWPQCKANYKHPADSGTATASAGSNAA
jgi:hypothetical protein